MSQALHFHIEEEGNGWTEAQPYYISIAINAGNEIRDSTNATGAVYLKFLKALFENVKKQATKVSRVDRSIHLILSSYLIFPSIST